MGRHGDCQIEDIEAVTGSHIAQRRYRQQHVKTRRTAIAVPSSNVEDKIEKREVCAVETVAVVKNEGENEAGNHSATAGTGAGTQCTNHRYGNLAATATRPTA